MNCDDVRIRLDARLDGELAAGEAAEVDAHVAGCADCNARQERRSALRETLRRELPRFTAPEALRQELVRSSREAPEWTGAGDKADEPAMGARPGGEPRAGGGGELAARDRTG